MLGDRGYDADWFRAALAERGITACIPSKTNRKIPIPHDTVLYRQRHRIENMFGKLKDWRRIQAACPKPESGSLAVALQDERNYIERSYNVTRKAGRERTLSPIWMPASANFECGWCPEILGLVSGCCLTNFGFKCSRNLLRPQSATGRLHIFGIHHF